MLSRTFIKIKKKLNIIAIILLCLFCFIPSTKAITKNDNLVNIYIIHSDNCSHCKEELKFLNKLEEKYSNVKIYKIEISDPDNKKILEDIEANFNLTITSVPLTIIGEKYYFGYNREKSPPIIKTTVDYYTKYGYKDEIGKIIGNIELPTKEISEKQETIDKYIKENSNIEVILGIKSDDIDLTSSSTLLGLKDSLTITNLLILIIITIIYSSMRFKNKLICYATIIILNSAYPFLVLTNKLSNIIIMSGLLTSISLFIVIKIIKKQNDKKKNILKYITATFIVNIALILKNIILKNELLTLNKILELNLIDNIYYIENIIIYIIGYTITNILILSLTIKLKNIITKNIINKKTNKIWYQIKRMFKKYRKNSKKLLTQLLKFDILVMPLKKGNMLNETITKKRKKFKKVIDKQNLIWYIIKRPWERTKKMFFENWAKRQFE